MTLEEALYYLDTIPTIGEQVDALEMAIKALKQQPCEDCISRQTVLDINEYHHGQMPSYLNHEIWEEIKALPSVTPKEKIGHWIRTTDKTGHLVWECDKCGWQQRFNTNFCPDCGARMEVSE